MKCQNLATFLSITIISATSFANQIGFCEIGADGVTKSMAQSTQDSRMYEGEISHFKVKVMQVEASKIPISVTDINTNLTYSAEMAMTGNKTVFVISKETQEKSGLFDSLAPHGGLTVFCQTK